MDDEFDDIPAHRKIEKDRLDKLENEWRWLTALGRIVLVFRDKNNPQGNTIAGLFIPYTGVDFDDDRFKEKFTEYIPDGEKINIKQAEKKFVDQILEELIDVHERTSLIYDDFKPSHIVWIEEKNRFSLIDFDSINENPPFGKKNIIAMYKEQLGTIYHLLLSKILQSKDRENKGSSTRTRRRNNPQHIDDGQQDKIKTKIPDKIPNDVIKKKKDQTEENEKRDKRKKKKGEESKIKKGDKKKGKDKTKDTNKTKQKKEIQTKEKLKFVDNGDASEYFKKAGKVPHYKEDFKNYSKPPAFLCCNFGNMKWSDEIFMSQLKNAVTLLEKRESSVDGAGFGVFATKDIKANETIPISTYGGTMTEVTRFLNKKTKKDHGISIMYGRGQHRSNYIVDGSVIRDGCKCVAQFANKGRGDTRDTDITITTTTTNTTTTNNTTDKTTIGIYNGRLEQTKISSINGGKNYNIIFIVAIKDIKKDEEVFVDYRMNQV